MAKKKARRVALPSGGLGWAVVGGKKLRSLIKATEYDPRRDGVTQGLLARWLRCRADAKFYLQGWRPIGRKRSLRFGSFIHDVLRAIYTAQQHKKPLPKKTTARIILKALESCVHDAIANREPAQDVETDAGIALVLTRHYVNHYQIDLKREWVNVEKAFDVQRRNRMHGLRLRGRRDGLFKLKKGGTLWLLETKTKSRIEGALEDALSFDFQNLFYLYSAHLELGTEVRGVLYNVVRVPQHPRKVGESLKAFCKRIEDDVAKRPDHFFKRYEITYSKRVRERFARELDMKLFEFLQWCDGVSQTYRNEGACQGRWNCSFIPACASGRMVGFTQTGRLFEELED